MQIERGLLALTSRRRIPAPTVQDRELNEVSGVAASRVHPPILWVHNDSGGEPAVHADPTRRHARRHLHASTARPTPTGRTSRSGPGPQARHQLPLPRRHRRQPGPAATRHRVPRPRTGGRPGREAATLTGVEHHLVALPRPPGRRRVDVRRPAQRRPLHHRQGVHEWRRQRVPRAEAPARRRRRRHDRARSRSFTVAPDDRCHAGVVRSPARSSPAPTCRPTAARCSCAPTAACSRSYARRGAPLAAAFGVHPCSAPAVDERQGEAVGFAADGASYFTISEGAGAPIHHFVARSAQRVNQRRMHAADAVHLGRLNLGGVFLPAELLELLLERCPPSTCTRGRIRSSHFGQPPVPVAEQLHRRRARAPCARWWRR